jgi:hypothetical protein
MQIHVARQSSQLGVFSAEEVALGLANGRFLSTDLAWQSGMPTWIALSEWPEFMAKVPPPLDGGNFDAQQSVTVPWELSRSLQSYWATIKGAIVSPAQTLAAGKYSFGDYILFSYITVLLTLPFTLFAQVQSVEANAQLADFFRGLNINELNKAADNLMSQPVLPVWARVSSGLFYAAIYPFAIAIWGFIQWLGLRLLRQSVTIERSIVATMVGAGLSNLIVAPLMLLSGHFLVYLFLVGLVMIPLSVLSCRAAGVVMRINPWFVFGSWALMGFIVSCCCCCLPAAVLGFINQSMG